MKKELTHIVGTFLIEANGAFLNGAGLGDGEDRNVTVPKTFRNGKDKVPYVSAQAWRRWLRNTLIEETGWPASELRGKGQSNKGSTNKIAGELNPVDYPEDDIFGYMMSAEGQGKGSVKSIMRTSPFSTSILVSLRKKGWRGRDEGFVHLKEGTPLPYTTEFYNTHLQGVFSLNYNRLGVFCNIGDKVELDESKVNKLLEEEKIEITNEKEEGVIYSIKNLESVRNKRVSALFNALGVLRGGAKQAAFGTDVSPKLIIFAGLSSGNPIFNQLFEEDSNGPELNIEKFIEIISDYTDRIVTPVIIGLRKGYLINEDDVLNLTNHDINHTVSIEIHSPLKATARVGELLE